MLVQMYVEVGMIVVDQPRQLVQLYLQHHHVGQVLSSHVMAEHQVTYHQERLFFTHLSGNKKYLQDQNVSEHYDYTHEYIVYFKNEYQIYISIQN